MSLTEHLLSKYQLQIKALTLVPSRGGVFEVWVDQQLVHSRRMTGQFPDEAKIDAALDERLKPA